MRVVSKEVADAIKTIKGFCDTQNSCAHCMFSSPMPSSNNSRCLLFNVTPDKYPELVETRVYKIKED